MLKRIEKYIEKHQLLKTNATVVVGVSGGADSVALLHILMKLGYNCVVAHCNFTLRAAESDRDEDFVTQLAASWSLPLFKVKFDTLNYAKAQKISIEMAARDLRYNWFSQLLIDQKADAIAVAHHSDDNVETLLMNLTRGVGLHGLTGIPKRNNQVVRPLLCLSRAEILVYLQKNDLSFVTDSSNAENEYTRNKFRNQLIPLFETINPSFKSALNETSERMLEAELIYKEHIQDLISKISYSVEHELWIDKQKLHTYSYKKTLLYELLANYKFSNDTINRLSDLDQTQPGAVFYSETHLLLNDRTHFIVSPRNQTDKNSYLITKEGINSPIIITIKERINDGNIRKSPLVATVDASKLCFPLTLRRWNEADSFIPFGMKGRKKLSDFFIDQKMNRLQKENCWLITSNNQIVWIVGYRADNQFRADETVRNLIELELIK
ncbi:MAG: tRNA lysidine(34) synthetase TilS [Paludibacter sp.]|nr:tRNA lysidine(34) synthetase TilS [Paludibacter sp.]